MGAKDGRPIDEYVRKSIVHRVLDGDTLDLLIDLGWGIELKERVRLLGVAAPELRGPEKERGKKYRDLAINWCDQQRYVWLHSFEFKRGKYGRTIGTVWAWDYESSLNAHINHHLLEDRKNDQ